MMRRLLFAFLMYAGVATAQTPATLIADQVTLQGDVLTASGNVMVAQGGTQIAAEQITYNQATDQLQINGPILVTLPDGTILTATQATLDPQVRNGLLLGARLIIDERLQLAAARIDRSEGRYSRMSGVAATSCQVCPGKEPLWSIRASTVVHDEVERQIWFEGAQIRIRSVPILWVPSLRLPDPTVKRARGWLLPKFTSSDQLGVGLKLPYFVPLGDSRDLTVTPWVTAQSRSVELRYRQAFSNGNVELNGAISRDNYSDKTRAYLFADAALRLPYDWRFNGRLELAEDDAYLSDYGISSQDRLESDLNLTKITGRRLSWVGVTGIHSFRDQDDNATDPTLLFYASHEERFDWAGGQLGWTISADAFNRRAKTVGDGRDMARLSFGASWDRGGVLPMGLEWETRTEARADAYGIWRDTQEGDMRISGAAGLRLGYPLIRRVAGATHIIEPQLLLAWSDSAGANPTAEDSLRSEFDTANLFALTRLSGQDSVETGARLSLGATWTMQTAGGTQTTFGIGRIFRENADYQFTLSSGLSEAQSDWLLSFSLSHPSGLWLDSRSLLTDFDHFNRSETRIGWDGEYINLTAAHVFLEADLEENRLGEVSEWSLDGSWQIDDTWSLKADARYDAAAEAPRKLGLGIEWRNECARLGLTVSRSYTSSDNVTPATNIGFQVGIDGFSADPRAKHAATSCRR